MFANKYMQLALSMAEQAYTEDEVPVGAVIIDPTSGAAISASYNLIEHNNDPTAHAEMLAIQTACQKLSSKYLTGLDLYVTLQPCMMCLQAAIYARVRRIYFGAYDHDMILKLPQSSNHKIEIYGGVCELESKQLLDKFFASKR